MNPARRLDQQPRIHRVEFINRYALSDCCGAPILPGGICFECRERCTEADGKRRSTPAASFAIAREEQPVAAKIDISDTAWRDDESANTFDEMVLKIICA